MFCLRGLSRTNCKYYLYWYGKVCIYYLIITYKSIFILTYYLYSNLFEAIEYQSIMNDDGLYNVTQVVTLNAEQLEDVTEFVCELAIPETNFTIDKKLTFIPGM